MTYYTVVLSLEDGSNYRTTFVRSCDFAHKVYCNITVFSSRWIFITLSFACNYS